MELVAEAEWLITMKKATHMLIDGIQNSVPDNVRGTLNLETEVQQRLKALNKRALVVLTEVLYCREHQQYNNTLHLINRQVRRMIREASGLASPQPWRALSSIHRDRSRKKKDQVTIFPDSFTRDGYHINQAKILNYEAELAAFMAHMVASNGDGTCE